MPKQPINQTAKAKVKAKASAMSRAKNTAPAAKAKSTAKSAAPVGKPATPKRQVGGLGRGLDALFNGPSAIAAATFGAPEPAKAAGGSVPDTATPKGAGDAANGTLLTASIDSIAVSPWQPRSAINEDTEAFGDLVLSIRAHGIIQPLVCRRLASGALELIAGNRRLNAARKAGLTEVPVVLLDAADRDAAEMTLIENIQREDLNPIEEAEAYHQLGTAFNLTQEEIADRVGRARPSVGNALRLLDLSDEIKQHVSTRLLSMGHAKLLLSVDDLAAREQLAMRCVMEGWTVKTLDERIKRLKATPRTVHAPAPDLPADHLRLLERKLRELVAAKVRLTPSVRYANGRRGKGCIEIDFADNDELDGILSRLGVNVNEGIF